MALVGTFSHEWQKAGLALASTQAEARKFLFRPTAKPLLLTLILLGLTAVLLDAYTTLAMMSSGLTEEGNFWAAAGMDAVGREAYVALASLVSLAIVFLSLARGPGLLPRALVTFSLVFVSLKLYIGLANLALWASLT